MSTWAVVLAAGRGTRAGLGYNKVFHEIQGRPVLYRCLDALSASEVLDGAVLVISAEDVEEYRTLCTRMGEHPFVQRVVCGGDCRRRSVYNGLRALPQGVEIVAVHDAARPFVSSEIIRATIESARTFGSGVISTPLTDTIKQIDADGIVHTLDRASLRAVQTPQSFELNRLLQAHEWAEAEGYEVTDDAALFEYYYGSVRLVTAPGAEENKKLTTKSDFEHLNTQPVMRIGSGYDAHRLVEGRKLILCGVNIPHTRGLDGHSDADVAVHALMDAILGALAEGDIGRHFPDSAVEYKGISSMLLLQRVMELVRARGYRVGNVDVTIVAQRPKLAPYVPQMRINVAKELGISVDCVNVKATTTEHMGFEGEEIGISAQAVALLVRA